VRDTIALLAACLLLPSPAAAQQSDSSHWGVGVSFTPQWKSIETMQRLLLVEGDQRNDGSEVSFGLVRGSTRGGDWGISFVHKPFKDTTIVDVESGCDNGSCSSSTATTTFQDVRLRGLEFHGFFALATIANRVQIGLNVAGGFATVEGTITETFESIFSFTRPDGEIETFVNTDTRTAPAREVLYEIQPLGKIEVQGAVIVAPGLKVKVGGGFNYPGTGFRIGAVYLIGAR
jgi:hypothetical protein